MSNPKLFFKDKSVVILGLGEEGFASAVFAKRFTDKVTLLDEKPKEAFSEKKLKTLSEKNIELHLGQKTFSGLKDFDIIIRSPGINLRRQELILAKKLGLNITSQTKLFFEFCPCPIIGITGTKGKSTVSSLIYEFVKSAITKKSFYPKKIISQSTQVYLTGNIGTIPPFEILDKLKKTDLVVYEASSFQLEDQLISPHIAVLTEIAKDHLDYHKTLAEYLKAKTNIVKYQNSQDIVVYPKDNSYSSKIAENFESQKIPVVVDLSPNSINQILLTKKIVPINYYLASQASLVAGVKESVFEECLVSFKTLAHRIELVSKKQGVNFYDDSASTVPEATLAAIKTFDGSPLVLILGGRPKAIDYEGFYKSLSKLTNIHSIVLIGENRKILKSGLISSGFSKKSIFEYSGKEMSEIFEIIRKVARKGDTVLLSPAATAFGTFENYKHRGDEFKKYAKKY